MTPAPAAPAFSWRILGLVVLGGMLGVAARAALLWPFQAVTSPVVVPVVTAGINVVGALVLGIVVGALDGRHPSTRAFLGTGILGGFTTYSAFAVQLVAAPGQATWVAVAIGLFSLVAGFFAAGLGVGLGRAMGHRATAEDRPEDAE